MLHAVVFDWDGTIVSCEEKIDLTVIKLCIQFPRIKRKYKTMVTKSDSSPGWIRKGFVASLPEDYLSYHFGIVADLIAKDQNLTVHSAWSVILSTFKNSYLEVRSKMLADPEKLYCLSDVADLYVVSNSETGNIKSEAKTLGIERGIVNFIGNAKKYDIVGSEPSILSVPVNRPKYREVLGELQKKHSSVIVVGDNFCLDLVTPISMDISVAHVPNPLTSKSVIRYVKKNSIIHGAINDILDTLIIKKGNLS